MKKKAYRGWTIYKVCTGSNRHMREIRAMHPLRVARLEITLPDSGTITLALAHIKRDIDAIETAGVPA